MKNHRKLVREYSEAWLHFRTEKEINADNKFIIAVSFIFFKFIFIFYYLS